MTPRRMSEARFLIFAAVLHGALPVAAFVAPAQVIDAPFAPLEVAVEVEVEPTKAPAVEVEPPRVEPPLPSKEARSETPSAARTETRPGNVEPGPIPSGAPTVEPQATSAPVAPTAPPIGTSEYDGPPPAVPMGPVAGGGIPGLTGPAWGTVPGVIPDMGRPPPAPTTSPQTKVDPKIATKVINEVLKEGNKALGLDLPGSGSVASAVRNAVFAANTPAESRATFSVQVSPAGKITSVRVTSSSGGSPDAWAAAAKMAAATLAAQMLAMNATYAKGATIYVTAHSTTTLPDGSKSAVERKGLGGSFDVTSAGAHLQHVVRVSHSVVAVQ